MESSFLVSTKNQQINSYLNSLQNLQNMSKIKMESYTAAALGKSSST